MLLILKILQELDSAVFGNTISSLLEIWYNRHAIGVREENKKNEVSDSLCIFVHSEAFC